MVLQKNKYFFRMLLELISAKYGLPLDSRHTYTKSDWEMFIAAISTNETRNLLIDKLALWINETSTGTLHSF